jgi:ankyrin repeat protein
MTMRYHRYGLVVVLALSIVVAGGAGLLTPSHHITEEYNTAFAAAENGDLAALQSAVAKDPALLKATEWDHQTLLHDAVRQKRVDVVRFLLDNRIDINAVTDDGLTALHMAAQNGDIPMLTLLLERGAKLNPLDSKGWTPQDRAQKWGHTDAAIFLRNRGAPGH